MIKNVVFDVGNVIVGYLPLEYIMSLGFDRETSKALVIKTFGHDLWLEHDRGLYSHDELWDTFESTNPDSAADIRKLRDDWWPDRVPLIEDSAAFLRECNKSGYNTYILSNFNAEMFAYIEERFPVLAEVRGKVVSGAEKLMKPEPAIYTLLLERFELTPSETVFIDDKPENIEAAKAQGIYGIIFADPAQMRRDFAAIVASVKSSYSERHLNP